MISGKLNYVQWNRLVKSADEIKLSQIKEKNYLSSSEFAYRWKSPFTESKQALQEAIQLMRDTLTDPEKVQGKLTREDKVQLLQYGKLPSCHMICKQRNYIETCDNISTWNSLGKTQFQCCVPNATVWISDCPCHMKSNASTSSTAHRSILN